jgi:3-dehydroquinate synthase
MYNAAMARVSVQLGARSYDIVIGRGLTDELVAFTRSSSPASAVVVTDATVGAIHGDAVSLALGARRVTIPAGEQSKSLSELQRVYDELLAPGDLDRTSLIVALGGGVVGDLAGFAAATLFRGVRWLQVPTTFMAMVDSAIGGKTAINHAGKNRIGAVHQPAAVFCDIDYLVTLPEREYVSALAEVVKTAALSGRPMLDSLTSRADAILRRDAAAIAETIEACARFKARLVGQDELDASGHRAILNFGHSLAHALEHLYPGRWLHGEAVAMGLCGALRLSVERAELAPADAQSIIALLLRFGLRVDVPADLDADAAARAIMGDKKRVREAIRMIVLREPGRADALSCRVNGDLLRTLMGPRDE